MMSLQYNISAFSLVYFSFFFFLPNDKMTNKINQSVSQSIYHLKRKHVVLTISFLRERLHWTDQT